MKKCIIEKSPFTISFAISCLLFVTSFLITGCQKIKPETILNESSQSARNAQDASNDDLLIPNPHPFDPDLSKFPTTLPPDQLIVWLKPGETKNHFNKWVDSVRKVGG